MIIVIPFLPLFILIIILFIFQNKEKDELDISSIKTEAVDYASFSVDKNEYVQVYTDGTCLNNGKKEARAGIGIWFGDSHPLYVFFLF